MRWFAILPWLVLSAPGWGQFAQNLPDARPVYSVAAEMVYPLDDLLDRGLLPITVLLEGKQQLAMLDLATGQHKWRIPLDKGIETLAVSGEHLLLFNGEAGGVLSVTEGKPVWYQRAEGLDRGHDSAPIFPRRPWHGTRRPRQNVIGGAVLLGQEQFYARIGRNIYGITTADGQVAWSVPMEPWLNVPLQFCGDKIIASTWGTGLWCIDPAAGKLVWGLRDFPPAARVHSVDDSLYHNAMGGLQKVDPATGRALWNAKVGTNNDQFVLHAGGKVVVITPGLAEVLDPATGNTVWKQEVAGDATAVLSDKLYFVPKEKRVPQCLDLASLQLAWTGQALKDTPIALVPADGMITALGGGGWATGIAPLSGALAWHWDGPFMGGFTDPNTIFTVGPIVWARAFKWAAGWHPSLGKTVAYLPYDVFFGRWLGVAADRFFAHDGHRKILHSFALTTP
ncbi:MAG: PQQ-binding-like beta-propeller repeat protein [Fimbriimonadaceae bacterium]|nr:PQQ-binding-like beta-propeller repeat protein [Fimbriimonadaceae bacterium]